MILKVRGQDEFEMGFTQDDHVIQTFSVDEAERRRSVMPPSTMYPGLVANVIAVVAVALLPLLLASVVSGRRHRATRFKTMSSTKSKPSKDLERNE